MSILVLLLLLAVVGAVAVVAAGHGGSLPDAEADRSPSALLPDGPLERGALEQVRFPVVFRGYRMDEVDRVLDRLAGELEERDARIAALDAGREAGA